MVKHLLILAIGMLAFTCSYAQVQDDLRLALEFYSNGEYEKAVSVYEDLYSHDKNLPGVYNNYLDCLIRTEAFKEAESIAKQKIKEEPQELHLRVGLAKVYQAAGKEKKAISELDDAVSELGRSRNQVIRLGQALSDMEDFDRAMEVYNKGNQMFANPALFAYELASIYKLKGDVKNLIGSFLDLIEFDPTKGQMVKTTLQRTLNTDLEFKELESQLYRKIQRSPELPVFAELLVWHYIQVKNFEDALIQAKAMDKRHKESGKRIMDLASAARGEKQYAYAFKAYDYLISKGKTSAMYLEARQQIMQTHRDIIMQDNNYEESDIVNLKRDYSAFIREFGTNNFTVQSIRELAMLEARYLNELDSAILRIESVIKLSGINRFKQAECKLDLGDYYLLSGNVWEATLIYGQVDKAFKDEPIGEEARFRNAKLSYYKGEFEWAQAQLSILKASTSELISNDALYLSIFIIDNLGLDSSVTPMQLFAKAELLTYQHNFEAAVNTLDTIVEFYPGHALLDDIWFARAKIYHSKREYIKAADMLNRVITEFEDGILIDNALFMLAEMNELHLDQADKAKQLYETILTEHPGSLFSVEARKRYRRLRGDQIN